MYIDPGSGGLLFQALAVIFGLASGAVLLFSSRIKMGIAKGKRWWADRNPAADVSSEEYTDTT